MTSSHWIGGVVFGLLSSLFLAWILARGAHRAGLIDRPDSRKRHDSGVPLVGGVAMFVAFCVAMLAADTYPPGYQAFLLGAMLLIVVGVLDDRYALSTRIRLVAQVGAALLLTVGGGVVLRDLGDLSFIGTINLAWLAVPFTVFAVVGVVNALNMADGVDGLAGGLTVITLAALAYLTWDAGRVTELAAVCVLMAVVMGFLAWNVRTPWRAHAAIFMGDAGSMFLGLALGWLLVGLSQGADRVIAPVTALWLLALPLMDTVSLMIRRPRNGHSPFDADREHFHHVLQRAGFRETGVVAVVWGLAALFAVAGIAGQKAGIPEGVMFWSFSGLFLAYHLAMKHSRRVLMTPHRPRERERVPDTMRPTVSNSHRANFDRRYGQVLWQAPERRSGVDQRAPIVHTLGESSPPADAE